MEERIRRALGGLGRLLITSGLLILLFVAYQLWGTGYFTGQAQDDLRSQFEQRLAAATSTTAPGPTATTVPPTTGAPTTTTTPSSQVVSGATIPTFRDGDAIGIIHLPWGDYAIIEGTSRNDLKQGPGHYPATVFPGELGNAAIAGHRTTYLAPFGDLDTLHTGSTFRIDTLWGHYTYRVRQEPYAVTPDRVDVVRTLDPTKATITLTACHPKFSARQRLVVQADLVVVANSDAPRPAVPHRPTPTGPSQPTAKPETDTLRDGLAGDPTSHGPAIAWGIAVALVGLLWWLVYRHWRLPLVWIAGFVPFVPVLLAWYVYLERALPAGY